MPDTSSNNTITITLVEYERLKSSKRMLEALESHGVDNWEWYSEAFRDAYPEDD